MGCYSDEGLGRAEKALVAKQSREITETTKRLFHIQAQRYSCTQDAQRAIEEEMKRWQYVELKKTCKTRLVNKFGGRGRPKKDANPDSIQYQIAIEVKPRPLVDDIKRKALFILGTSVLELTPQEVIATYKQQGHVERGFRFLKDPYFFVSSLYLKSPKRIESLLMVMTLALLVYTIAQRRLRRALKATSDTIPNQIHKPTATPTLRWVFQIFFGINIVEIKIKNRIQRYIKGLNELHTKILKLLSGHTLALYSP